MFNNVISGKTAYRILDTEGADDDAKRWYFAARSTVTQIEEFVEVARRDGRGLSEVLLMLRTDDPYTNNHIRMAVGKAFGCY